MHFRVAPGLHRLGAPDGTSPVFVSANYRLSFDALRTSLSGMDAWILVLDTKGVNVWCAASKGTFGTDELVRCIAETGLADRLQHRRIIVPQLGAPGVAGRQVRERTGFSVVWGPVEGRDIPAFLQAGLKATPAMRSKHFPLVERIKVTPIELEQAVLPLALVLALIAATMLVGGSPVTGSAFLRKAGPVVAAVLAGAFMTPILLPWIPFRALAAKGALVGVFCSAFTCLALGLKWPASLGWILLPTALASFLAMNFTGATTFSNPSGVRKELRYAIPAQIATAVAGLVLVFLL
jgi:acetyl-CoA decarbonylase/synthase complex subunit gamma